MSAIRTDLNRREFLQSSVLAGSSLLVSPFLTGSNNVLFSQVKKDANIPGFPDNRILVVLMLGGGNDGLNTVIPYADDNYYKQRPRLAVRKDDILTLDDHLGFHNRLKDLKLLYDEGNVAVINGVGYPDPDRSHFRSTEIWETASDSSRFLSSGWIGNYFNRYASRKLEAVCGVCIGSTPPQSFAESQYGVSFQRPEQFKWFEGPGPDNTRAFAAINFAQYSTGKTDSTIDFLRHTTATMLSSSEKVNRIAKIRNQGKRLRQGKLANDLNTISSMIKGGLPTRIYYVSHGGFDTHANQRGVHENLLAQFSAAVAAFHKDLQQSGHSKNVVIMAFSEFGRRVSENASGGTDHGTAGPMFLIGDAVQGGLFGRYPSLVNLDQGDLKHTVDFRSVYATVIKKWLKADPRKVLGKSFKTLELF